MCVLQIPQLFIAQGSLKQTQMLEETLITQVQELLWREASEDAWPMEHKTLLYSLFASPSAVDKEHISINMVATINR